MDDWSTPSLPLLVKIGSALIHAKEFMGTAGHPLDKTALDALLDDADVKEWLQRGVSASLLPMPREEPAP